MSLLGVVTFIAFRVENIYSGYAGDNPVSASNSVIGGKTMV